MLLGFLKINRLLNYTSIRFALILICLLIPTMIQAKQHRVVEQLINNSRQCIPNYIFGEKQIQDQERQKAFLAAVKKLNPDSKLQRGYDYKNFFLIPVNNCVLRANRYYADHLNSLNKTYNIKRIINFDLLVDKSIHKKHKDIEYLYMRINSSQYPKAESLRSLITTLDYLSEATPEERVLLTCFFGKHRTGLISAIYQFLLEYSLSPEQACNQISFDEDPIYLMMNQLAEHGFFVHRMPAEFKEFYIDFSRAVCNGISYEFLEGEIFF